MLGPGDIWHSCSIGKKRKANMGKSAVNFVGMETHISDLFGVPKAQEEWSKTWFKVIFHFLPNGPCGQ